MNCTTRTRIHTLWLFLLHHLACCFIRTVSTEFCASVPQTASHLVNEKHQSSNVQSKIAKYLFWNDLSDQDLLKMGFRRREKRGNVVNTVMGKKRSRYLIDAASDGIPDPTSLFRPKSEVTRPKRNADCDNTPDQVQTQLKALLFNSSFLDVCSTLICQKVPSSNVKEAVPSSEHSQAGRFTWRTRNFSGVDRVALYDALISLAPQRMHSEFYETLQRRFLRAGLETCVQINQDGVRNVVGILPGTEKKEVLVIGGKWTGNHGCKGLDDNASGLAVMIKLADELFRYNIVPEATVIFVAYSNFGNHKLFHGSDVFIQEYLMPNYLNHGYRMLGAYNLDRVLNSKSRAVGRSFSSLLKYAPDLLKLLGSNLKDDFLLAIGRAGKDQSLTETLVDNFNRLSGHFPGKAYALKIQEIKDGLQNHACYFHQSDHFSFWKNGLTSTHVYDSGFRAGLRRASRNSGISCEVDDVDLDRLKRLTDALFLSVVDITKARINGSNCPNISHQNKGAEEEEEECEESEPLPTPIGTTESRIQESTGSPTTPETVSTFDSASEAVPAANTISYSTTSIPFPDNATASAANITEFETSICDDEMVIDASESPADQTTSYDTEPTSTVPNTEHEVEDESLGATSEAPESSVSDYEERTITNQTTEMATTNVMVDVSETINVLDENKTTGLNSESTEHALEMPVIENPEITTSTEMNNLPDLPPPELYLTVPTTPILVSTPELVAEKDNTFKSNKTKPKPANPRKVFRERVIKDGDKMRQNNGTKAPPNYVDRNVDTSSNRGELSKHRYNNDTEILRRQGSHLKVHLPSLESNFNRLRPFQDRHRASKSMNNEFYKEATNMFNDINLTSTIQKETYEEHGDLNNRRDVVNVIARLEGQRYRTDDDLILLVGAHYDTPQGSPGVDINGSGVVLLLQIASALVASGARFLNTIYFVLFDAGSQDQAGSGMFIQRHLLTHLIDPFGSQLLGAFILNGLLNFNTSEGSQLIDKSWEKDNGDVVKQIEENQNRGDFISVVYRKTSDDILAETLRDSWNKMNNDRKQMKLLDAGTNIRFWKKQKVENEFTNGDHTTFWKSGKFKAVAITDTGRNRKRMDECYHQPCDNFDTITPENLQFMKKVGEALLDTIVTLAEPVS